MFQANAAAESSARNHTAAKHWDPSQIMLVVEELVNLEASSAPAPVEAVNPPLVKKRRPSRKEAAKSQRAVIRRSLERMRALLKQDAEATEPQIIEGAITFLTQSRDDGSEDTTQATAPYSRAEA